MNAFQSKTMISPSFSEDKLESGCINDLIDIFEDRMKLWMFEPARMLLRYRYGPIPSVQLLIPYFECIITYIKGEDSERKSRQYFEEAFLSVFTSQEVSQDDMRRAANFIYKEIRCGFFHVGMSGKKIEYSFMEQSPIAVTVPKKDGKLIYSGEIGSILINPEEFLKSIENHFKRYIAKLRNPANTDLRDRFETVCRLKWGLDEPPNIIGLPCPK